jgi:hypothetical protein
MRNLVSHIIDTKQWSYRYVSCLGKAYSIIFVHLFTRGRMELESLGQTQFN